MPSMFDVRPEELIREAAKTLKNEKLVTPPSWAPFVKTGAHKQRPPQDEDWWYQRSAAVLRKIHINGPIGVSKLRRHFGGRKNRGHKPEHFFKGSGNVLRKVLQQLEASGLAKQVDVQGHKGRVVTPKGLSLLDKTASSLMAGGKKEPLFKKVVFIEKKKVDHDKLVEQLIHPKKAENPAQSAQSEESPAGEKKKPKKADKKAPAKAEGAKAAKGE